MMEFPAKNRMFCKKPRCEVENSILLRNCGCEIAAMALEHRPLFGQNAPADIIMNGNSAE